MLSLNKTGNKISSLDILFNYLRKEKYPNVGFIKMDKLQFNAIFTPQDKLLTFIDGAILVDQNFTKLSKDYLLNRLKSIGNAVNITDKLRKDDLKLSLTKWKDENVLYIVASLNQINKIDVDNKIKQIMEFQKIIKNLKSITSIHEHFNNMVNTNKMDKFPENIHIYLNSDNISESCREYILHLNNGTLTKELYKTITYNMLLEYDKFEEFITNIELLKPQFYDFDSLLDFLTNYTLPNKKLYLADIIHFKTFLIDYENINLEWAKDRIGLIYQNKISV
jgi:hypothetical protein